MTPKARFKRLQHARELRAELTHAEVLLWSRLRASQIGVAVRKQHPIGAFIADFCVPKIKLVIELDGAVHETSEARERDRLRDEWMAQRGYIVLRFKNDDIETNIDAVVMDIRREVARLQEAPFRPPAGGGKPELRVSITDS